MVWKTFKNVYMSHLSHLYMQSKLSQTLHEFARQRGIVLDDGPMHYDPYSNGYSPAVPICHICGIHGHTPADCQHGGYSPTPDCFCRHSGNQGTTGRPATAHDTLLKISLRTRRSSLVSLARDLSSRGCHRLCSRFCQGPGAPSLESLARHFPSRGLIPREGLSLGRASSSRNTAKYRRTPAPPSRDPHQLGGGEAILVFFSQSSVLA